MKAVPLGEIVPGRSGTVDPAKYPDELFELYSIPAYDRGTPDLVPGREIGSAKQVVQPGDVLLSRIVPHIRRSWVVGQANGRRIIASGEWMVFRSPAIHPPWLRHILLGDQFHRQFMATVAGVGGSLMRARPAHVATIAIPLPPLPEQRRIAAVLDHADTLRAKRRQALALFDEVTRSIYDEFTGNAHWPTSPLIDLCASPDDIKCGPFGTQLQKSEVTDGGVPLWGIKNVNSYFSRPAFEYVNTSTAERLRPYSVTAGDIVMTRKGTVGNCAVYPRGFPDGIMHSDLLRVRLDPRRASSPFFAYQLHHDPRVEAQIARMSSGAVMPGINVGKLKGLEVTVPPPEVQAQFQQRADAVSAMRQRADSRFDKLDELFASLQSRAFRGEL